MAKKEENAEQLTPQQQKMKALQAAMAKIEKDCRLQWPRLRKISVREV